MKPKGNVTHKYHKCIRSKAKEENYNVGTIAHI